MGGVVRGLVCGLVGLGLATALTACGGTGSSPAAASCAGLTESELYEIADVVFTGSIAGDETAGDRRRIVFDVERVYKGQASSRQVVVTAAARGLYGIDGVAGSGSFVVLGRYGGGTVVADLCGGSRPGPAPAGFGPGRLPEPGTSGYVGPWWPTWTGPLLSVGLLALLLGWYLRRLRRGGRRNRPPAPPP